MKVVVNRCYGGFSVNESVYKALGIKWDEFGFIRNDDLGINDDNWNAYRSDPRLIAAIEKVGVDMAGGLHSKLEIVEIPDNIKWFIDEYDGKESIHEEHRSW